MKKFMFVNRKAPYGTIYALESLEVVLITATLDQDVSLVFMDDGVYELVKGQQTKDIGIKNFSPSYRALEGYDVEKLYVERESLQARGIAETDLRKQYGITQQHTFVQVDPDGGELATWTGSITGAENKAETV